MKKEGDEKSGDQTSWCRGRAVQKGSMWTSVRGSSGRLTSGLHYKRKAPEGSDPIGTCEGVVAAPARNKQNSTSGGRAQATRGMQRGPIETDEGGGCCTHTWPASCRPPV